MNRHCFLIALIGAALNMTACTEEMVIYEQDISQCNDAQTVNISGDQYCVYESEVIVEEGFICPPDTPFLHQESGFGICSSLENDPTERLQEVVEQYEANLPGVGNNNQGETYPEPGAICVDPAPLLIDVEPIIDPEEWIVSFPEGTDVQAEADALSQHYNFEVVQVFNIIPAFTGLLTQEQVGALACYGPVLSIEQSRSDTPPPTNDVGVSNFTAMCDEDIQAGVSTLALTDLGAGAVQVQHTNVEENCCSEPMPRPTIFENRLVIDYQGDQLQCNCICSYTMNYTLSGLTDGLWTIEASGNVETIEVNVE